MGSVEHPAFAAFAASIEDEVVLAQVLIRRAGKGFELRHVDDRQIPQEGLRSVPVEQLRELAQFTNEGSFRPLKSAPNLRRGWLCLVPSGVEFARALEQLYPGAVIDWFAAQSGQPPLTHYREFTGRQSGMYRITAKLDDAQAAAMIRACCDRRFCLKRRLWSVEGLPPESAATLVEIPCLEPCAVLLEFARKAMRIEQEEATKLELSPSDLASVIAGLEQALGHPGSGVREADFGAAENRRRVQLALEKLRAMRRQPER